MNKTNTLLGIDIGGSHISAALVDIGQGEVLKKSYLKKYIDPSGSADQIISTWLQLIVESLSQLPITVKGIGIAMPGPFDYENGISLIQGLSKYDALYGINIKGALQSGLGTSMHINFENDATCFGLGEYLSGHGKMYKKVIAVTLGTGIGAAFIDNGELVVEGHEIPPGATLYHLPFKNGIAEDFISARWLLHQYKRLTGKICVNVEELACNAVQNNNPIAKDLFTIFGENTGHLLAPWIIQFKADCLILGGGIARAADLFAPRLLSVLAQYKINIPVKISKLTELSAIRGAAVLASKTQPKNSMV